MAVDRQEGDTHSLLNLTRRLLAFRNAHPAMRLGDLTVIEASDTRLVIERVHAGERLCCAFNFADRATPWTPPAGDWRVVEQVNGAAAATLPPFGGVVLSA